MVCEIELICSVICILFLLYARPDTGTYGNT